MPDLPSAQPSNDLVKVGGDFARVFDQEDYMSMINALDEATVVLRAHLVLEEFLNIWCSRITGTEDLFTGAFVPFKTKLVVARNLGLAKDYDDILDKFNEIRNRYSHRRKYALEMSALDALRVRVNALSSNPSLLPCEDYHIFVEGVDQNGQRKEIVHKWPTADTKKKVLLVFVQLVMKFVQWMQLEFNERGIKYELVTWPANGINNLERAL